jgi:hypothetical protein
MRVDTNVVMAFENTFTGAHFLIMHREPFSLYKSAIWEILIRTTAINPTRIKVYRVCRESRDVFSHLFSLKYTL